MSDELLAVGVRRAVFPLLTAGEAGVRSVPLLGRTATMKFLTIRLLASLLIAPLTLWFPPVALDECDPTTFNAALGPEFCKNVALAFAFPSFVTKFADLFAKAAAGHPDRGWDFEPDKVTITKGTPLVVVN